MAGGFRLEDFSDASDAEEKATLPIQEVKKQSDASFDLGYKAGWEDSAKSLAQDAQNVSEDLAKNLRSAVLNTEDLRAQMLQSLNPILFDLVATILPELAQKSLAPKLVETILPMIEGSAAKTAQIVANPADSEKIQSLVDRFVDVPVSIVSEASIGPGQLFLKVGKEEKSIDTKEVLRSLVDAVDAFFDAELSKKGTSDATRSN